MDPNASSEPGSADGNHNDGGEHSRTPLRANGGRFLFSTMARILPRRFRSFPCPAPAKTTPLRSRSSLRRQLRALDRSWPPKTRTQSWRNKGSLCACENIARQLRRAGTITPHAGQEEETAGESRAQLRRRVVIIAQAGRFEQTSAAHTCGH
ncbi:hypothetical protein AAFF_G00096190 [Aldrovandia affinis]|uniref:Uncharacterized protein n=1 Tax=Aldrovandia affinis TaxID=143900 RepID=A0AAD7RVU9_9TELE|nr:hypothetical protein AAFF_G00096190 [Aldrovandia affinis]